MSLRLFFRTVLDELLYHAIFIWYLIKSDIVEIPLYLFSRGLRKRIASLGGENPRVVIDLLSGIGSAAVEFASLYPDARVFAVDIDPGALELVRKRAKRMGLSNVETVVADARELPFEADSADVINISFGLHENRSHDRKMIIGESMRVLKKGGFLLVADYGKSGNILHRAIGLFFLRFFEPEWAREVLSGFVERELKEAGFHLKKFYHEFPLSWFARAVKPDFDTVYQENRKD